LDYCNMYIFLRETCLYVSVPCAFLLIYKKEQTNEEDRKSKKMKKI